MGRPRTLAFLLALLAAGGGRAAAQERPQEAREREPRDTTAQDTIPRDTLPAGPALGYTPATVAFILTVGRPGGGEVQRQPVEAYRRDLSGTVLDSAALGRTVSLQGGLYAAVSAEVSLAEAWAVRLGAGFASATLEASYDGDDTQDLFVRSANATTQSADLTVLSLESTLLYRIPSSRRLRPYLELGAVYSRWSAEGELPEAVALQDPAPRFEALAGLGAVVPLNRVFSARLRASTWIFRTPVRPVATGDTTGTSSALVLVGRPAASTRFADSGREVLGLLRLEIGLSLDLGRPPSSPGRRDEAAETTPPPAR